ncbi:hypothetical protein FRC02_002343 [Tulasnella sp. 418]|nr:hypothetical protein FRC02_002343 [Tulasnella sp. 418]
MSCHPEGISNFSVCNGGDLTEPNIGFANLPHSSHASSEHDGRQDDRPKSTMLNIQIVTDMGTSLGTGEGFVQQYPESLSPEYMSGMLNDSPSELRCCYSNWPYPPINEDADDDQVPHGSSDVVPHLNPHPVLGDVIHSVCGSPALEQQSTLQATQTFTAASAHASLGRPASLTDAPGNWGLAHIDCLKRYNNLLSAAQRTTRLQVVRRHAQKMGNNPVARGCYGEVWKGRLFTPDHQNPWVGREVEVAIKVIHVKDDDYVRLLKRLFREIVPLSNLPPHPNILSVKGYLLQGNSAWIMSSWQNQGNALDYICSNDMVDKLKLISDIVAGLCYLHTREPPIVHGDLKLDNILIGDDYTAMLTDFGLSRIMDETPETTLTTSSLIRGSIYFLAPELLAGVKRSPASDIWALGGLLFQIATGKHPFYGMDKNSIIGHLYNKRTPTIAIDAPFSHKDVLLPMIQKCWEINPNDRPTAAEITSFLTPRY